jgi:N-acetylmuramoyl-L-alanine amidase
MSEKTIILDYGHGGIDTNGIYTTAPSKQSMVNGAMVHEGVLNRKVGGMLKDMLEWNGYKVVETVKRCDSTDLSLGKRIRKVNSTKNAVLVSIHHNASLSHKGRGFEIFTTKGQNNSDILAESIADSMQETCEKRYGLKCRFDHLDGDKDKEAMHYVTRKSIHPATLVECLFFDNEEDMKLHNNPEFLASQVSALYYGITNYIEDTQG